MSKKATMTDIAKKCGVSQTLVSFALSGKKDSVGEKNREKIIKCARELGYSLPHGTDAVKVIGFICDSDYDALPIIPLMIALSKELSREDYKLIFCSSIDEYTIADFEGLSGVIVATVKRNKLRKLSVSSLPFSPVNGNGNVESIATSTVRELISFIDKGKILTESDLDALEIPGASRNSTRESVWLL